MEKTKHNIAIIGKGVIGIGFAALFTGNGIPVTILAKDAHVGQKRYDDIFSLLLEAGLVSKPQASACKKLLHFTDTYAGIANADVIFECITENLSAKQNVYAKIEENCPHVAAIASASSVITPDDLAAQMNRKELLLVAHPYNPAYLVPCVELVPGQHTSAEALNLIKELLLLLKREVIVMKKAAPGFIANRLQHALFREAFHMVQEGIAAPEDIDRALMTSFAPRYTTVGLFEIVDNAGIDLKIGVDNYIFRELGTEDRAFPFLEEHVSRGELGIKTGKGIYEWTPEKDSALQARMFQPYVSWFNWDLPDV